MKQTIACCGLAALLGRRAGLGGRGRGLGRRRRREGRAGRSCAARSAKQRGLGRPQRAPRGRAERDRRLPGDRRGRRRRHPRALRRAARSCGGAAGRETIAYAPPAADPTLYAGRPIQLFSVRYMNVTAGDARLLGVEAGEPGRAAATRPAGSRCSSCPRTRAPGAAASRSRSGPGSSRRSGSRSTSAATSRPASTRARSRVTADGETRRCPSSCASSTSPCPTRTACRRWSTTSPTSPSSTRAGTSTRPTTASPTATGSSSCTRTTRRGSRRTAAASTGATSRAKAGYEGPGEGVGNTIVPVSFYGTGPGVRGEGERLEALRRVDGVPGADAAEGPRPSSTCPTSPTRRSTRRCGASRRTCARTRARGGACRSSSPRRSCRSSQGVPDIWCVPPQALDLQLAAAERARGRRVWTYNGGRPQGPTPVIDAPATEARVDRLGRVQARRRPLLLLARRPLAAQSPEAGREEAERVGEPDHVRQPGPAQEAGRGPGLHQRRRRAHVPRRGEAAPRGGPRDRGADRHRAAREPPPRAAGPPVPDARAPGSASSPSCRRPCGRRAARVLGRRARRSASPRPARPTRPPG